MLGVGESKGTGCQGYLPKGTSYAEVVKVFGEPNNPDKIDGKTQVEWIGKINGLVFTIYDYKSGIAPEENTDWHIGGKVKLAGELVNIYFKNCKDKNEVRG
jgi:hypothetical protein